MQLPVHVNIYICIINHISHNLDTQTSPQPFQDEVKSSEESPKVPLTSKSYVVKKCIMVVIFFVHIVSQCELDREM